MQRFRGPIATRDAKTGGEGHENQDLCTTRAQIQHLDRGEHFGWAKHIQKGMCYRVWPALLTMCRCGSALTTGMRIPMWSTPNSLETAAASRKSLQNNPCIDSYSNFGRAGGRVLGQMQLECQHQTSLSTSTWKMTTPATSTRGHIC